MNSRIIIALTALLGWSVAAADVLQMPAQPQAYAADGRVIEMPARGMTMGQVSRTFGEPDQAMAPVGEPPITRWVYGPYSVYFEGRYVIHAVPHRTGEPVSVGSPSP